MTSMNSSHDDLHLPEALAAIRAAAAVIGPHIRHTPTVYSYTFSESTGCDVYLKLENLQRTGSFKIRGALHKLLTMDPARRERGLIAASAGNHAQGVALAARICHAPATIVMPENTALIKVQRTEGYGARVILHGENYDAAQRHATALAAERGLTLVHPFDDRTVGLEILAEVPDLDTVVVPIGGGGLIAGIALAIKALAPHVRIVGVQAEGAAPTVQSFRSGERITVAAPRTIAEGIRVGSVGSTTFEIVRRLVDECVTVTEDEITDAVVQTMEKSKLVSEAAGAAGVAAVLSGRVRSKGHICAVVSGGNIDLNLLSRLIESGLSRAGRYHLVKLRVPDVPGQLSAAMGIIADKKGNVLDVQHYRSGWKVPVGAVDIEILIETRHAEHAEEVDRALRSHGFEVHAA